MESELFDEIGEMISGNKQSNMFGAPCFKIGRKPFILFYENQIVCKLFDEVKEEAMQLEGWSYFNPMKSGKGMENWVQIPYAHADKWEFYASMAYDFVEKGR